MLGLIPVAISVDAVPAAVPPGPAGGVVGSPASSPVESLTFLPPGSPNSLPSEAAGVAGGDLPGLCDCLSCFHDATGGVSRCASCRWTQFDPCPCVCPGCRSPDDLYARCALPGCLDYGYFDPLSHQRERCCRLLVRIASGHLNGSAPVVYSLLPVM